jgi:aryl-alcohol dehydrogenase-like predicted oxidoreductase
VKLRPFGNTTLSVSEFGLGCARIGGIFQKDSAGFHDLLLAARDSGINFFDTADIYSQGESETLVGRAFRGQRQRVIIASKAGYQLPARRMLAARLKPLLRPLIKRLGLKRASLPSGLRGAMAQDFSPAYLVKAVEGSLRRLRTDYLDLLQLHSPPLEVVERGDWVTALEGLKRSGKIRYYGVSCDTVDVGQAALRIPGVSSLQFVLSLLEQGASTAILPTLEQRGIAGIARESLANGLLVKRAGEFDLKQYCSSPEQEAQRTRQLEELRARANAEGKSLATLALEFATRQPGVSVTLLGARSKEQLFGLLRERPRHEG